MIFCFLTSKDELRGWHVAWGVVGCVVAMWAVWLAACGCGGCVVVVGCMNYTNLLPICT